MNNLHALQTEAAVLSILIAFNQSFDDVSDKLSPECFFDDNHRLLFSEIKKQSGKGFDVISLAEALKGQIDILTIHGIATTNDGSPRALSKHVETLIDRHKARMLHELSIKLGELALDDTPVQERIDAAQVEISKLTESHDSDEWIDAYTAAVEHSDLLEKRLEGKIQGINTGLIDLDEYLHGGMQRGNLVVLGARPAMGKTALALTIGLYVAQQHSVGFLSMEMSHADIRDRQTAILSQASISEIKRPDKGLEFGKIVDGIERSRNLKFYASDKTGLTILNVRSKARALKRKHGLDVLIIDYIGLMNGTNPKMMRAYQIEEISRGLKNLAKELDIVVICLAQVNRAAVQGSDKIPGLQDLRDSGAIEQDADVVGFIHRPIAADPALDQRFNNYAVLRIAKNRQGKTGDIHLFYDGELTHFKSWAGDAPIDNKQVKTKFKEFL